MSHTYNLHDKLADELFEMHSLTALAWLIAHGRELEFFTSAHTACFLSRHGSSQTVSLWENGVEQAFSSIEALFQQASLDGILFLLAWEHTELACLF